MSAFSYIASSLLLMSVLLACSLAGMSACNVLPKGYVLNCGQSLEQPPYRLVMQCDCNLVLYKDPSLPLWASHTNGCGRNCSFIMQNDGNAVIYDDAHQPVFATGTYGRNDGNHYILLQSDGNCVMYNRGGTPLWATNSSALRKAVRQFNGRNHALHAHPTGVVATGRAGAATNNN